MSRSRQSRRGGVNGLALVLFLIFGAGSIWVWTFGPYWWDFMEVKQVAKAAMLTWQEEETRQAAENRLDRELRKLEVNDYIFARDCVFREQGDLKEMDCAWAVDVFYPGTDMYRTLNFSVYTTINTAGSLSQEAG